MEIKNLEIGEVKQTLFDNFNEFIMSSDKRVFNKLIARTLLYNEVKNIPGDIVECGVFKGSGLFTFLKLKNLYNPNSSKKVIGFDFFNTSELISTLNTNNDKESMSTLFEGRNFEHNNTYKDYLENKLLMNGFTHDDFLLVQGDISLTSKNFSLENPGFKISILYMDLDLEKPTYDTLNNLWQNISKGGIIIFDEYGYHKWSESRGVDRFIEENGLQIHHLNYFCPTAYIKKI
jgi:hypothetical protein